MNSFHLLWRTFFFYLIIYWCSCMATNTATGMVTGTVTGMVTGTVTNANTYSFPCLFSNRSLSFHIYNTDYKLTNKTSSLKITSSFSTSSLNYSDLFLSAFPFLSICIFG